MSSVVATHPSPVLDALGDFRWVRGHVSLFTVGTVILVSINLLIAGPRLWSLTAIGIWSMLLVVHLVLLAIARLMVVLLADDDEEIVLLPIKDAVIVDPAPELTTTWTPPASTPDRAPGETVSWQIATDAAQVKRDSTNPLEDPST